MKKNIALQILLFILFSHLDFCIAQVPPHEQLNLEKYWIYRERLKDYMINGTAQGCVIPSQSRSSPAPGLMHWNDSPWFIGYWIGTLAMEYDLLVKSNAPALQISQTKQDLYNAIETVNRLDFEAESPLAWNCGASLNGFTISNDVPDDFHQRLYNGETGADLLNGSWVPPPDGFRVKCINSGFAQYVTPREVSQDHVAALFIGFSLVKKFVPTTLNSATPFLDGEINFVIEVQKIANRFINWMQSEFPHEWVLMNLCENRCVHGICNPTKPGFCGPHPEPPATDSDPCPETLSNKCSEGGALGIFGAIGFLSANAFVQGQPSLALQDAVKNIVLRTAWNIDMNFIAPDSPWKHLLATIGNIWNFVEISGPPIQVILSTSTSQVAKNLVKNGVDNHREHLILMHRLFYNTQIVDGDVIEIPNNYYECLLDNAPCRGYDGSALSLPNKEWSLGDRLGGEQDDDGNDGNANSGVGFLFYFNIYNEINPAYLGSAYTSIPIKDLALENIDKNNYTEYDKKNFMASNSITAHNGYIIDKDISIPNGDQGRVTFVAGQVIDLLPGFSVTNGATLNAYIDPSIGAMTCNIPAPSDAAVGCNYLEANLKIIQDTIQEFDTLFVFQDSTADTTTTLRVVNQTENNTLQKSAPVSYDISIIPNPSTGIFTLQLKENAQAEVFIYNPLGQVVYKMANVRGQMADVNTSTLNPQPLTIDLSSHPKGIYFLKVISGENVYTEKVVVQ